MLGQDRRAALAIDNCLALYHLTLAFAVEYFLVISFTEIFGESWNYFGKNTFKIPHCDLNILYFISLSTGQGTLFSTPLIVFH